jgi:hypothetical protein
MVFIYISVHLYTFVFDDFGKKKRFSEPMSVEKPPRNIHSSITQKTQNNNKWTISVWVAWNKASKYFNSLLTIQFQNWRHYTCD